MNRANTAQQSPRSSVALGLDVGGTKTSLVATDAADRLLLRETVSTDKRDFPEQLVGLCRAAMADLSADSGEQALAVGVAVPGHVDPLGRTLELAVNLGAPSLALADRLEEQLGIPAIVEHDARAAAYWLTLTAAQGETYLAYLSVGTGISAGIVLAGQLLRGVIGLAGEIGHVSVEPNGPLCGCGLRGCLEAVAAGPALTRLATEGRAGGRSSVLAADAPATQVFAAAGAGDELAIEIVDSVSGHLARAIRLLVLAYGVQHVVIGGGVAGAGEPLLQEIRAHLELERSSAALVDAALRHAVLELLPPETLAGARGAAALARDRLTVGSAGSELGKPGLRAGPVTSGSRVAQGEGVASS